MGNTLTGLIPTIFKAMDVVSRELVGFIPAVTIDASAEMAAKDQTITSHVVPAASAADITPAATGPDPSAKTIAPVTMSISKSRSSTFYWIGEEQKSLGGRSYEDIMQDEITQAMRTLINEVEADLAALYVAASRAYGTAAQTPFGTNLDESANVLKILLDNGAPTSDLQLVIDTAAGAKLRTLGQLTKANEAGNDSLLRRGVLMDIHGFMIRESAQVKTHTKGTGSAYVINGSHAIGATSLAVKTGSNTIVAGDVLALQNDGNKYVVTTGVGAPGTAVLGAPGLRIAHVDSETVTIGNNYTANMAFSRSAIRLLTRVPERPLGGDAADEVEIVTDPVSGLSFSVASYRQYHRVAYEVGLAWGVKANKPEHIAIMLG